MHWNLIVTFFFVVNNLNRTVLAGCSRTNDHKNYTCTDMKFHQLRTSPNNKKQILRTRIHDCKETLITEELLPFPNLENLTISCDIEQIHPNGFRNLNHLQELDLGNNTISALPNDMFQSLGELKTLNLSNNNCEELTRPMFEGLSNLKQLSVSYNAISQLDTKALSELKQLEELCLNNNRINFIPVNLFRRTTKLRRVDLAHNFIVDLGQLFLPTQRLSHLNLSHNLIKELPPGVFQTTQLIVLDLSYNELTVVHEDSLKLDTIQELHLQNNKISLLEVKATTFPKISLNLLDVRNNRLVFLEEDFIRKATNLLTIRAGGNPWDCECLNNMEALRSDLRVQLNSEIDAGEQPTCVSNDSDGCNVDRSNLVIYYNLFVEQAN